MLLQISTHHFLEGLCFRLGKLRFEQIYFQEVLYDYFFIKTQTSKRGQFLASRILFVSFFKNFVCNSHAFILSRKLFRKHIDNIGAWKWNYGTPPPEIAKLWEISDAIAHGSIFCITFSIEVSTKFCSNSIKIFLTMCAFSPSAVKY